MTATLRTIIEQAAAEAGFDLAALPGGGEPGWEAAYTGSSYATFIRRQGQRFIKVRARVSNHGEPPSKTAQGFGSHINVLTDYTPEEVRQVAVDTFQRALKVLG